MKRSRTSMAPMAVSSAGEIVLNVREFENDASPRGLLRYAERTGFPVFVGIVVPPEHRKRIMGDIDDAVADITGRFGPVLLHRKKGR
jgi:hypothetical protein